MKIVLLRFSSAGDIILVAEVIKKLKQIKNAQIYLVVKEINAAPAGLTGATQVLALDVKKGLNSAVKAINSLSPDIIIDLQGNFRSKYITFFAKAKEKYYYAKDIFKRRFMVMFKWFLAEDMRIAERYIKTAQPLLKKYAIETEIPPVKKVTKGEGVLIHGGAKWPLKRWPHTHSLAKLLAEKKIPTTLTGLKAEIENTTVYDKNEYIKDLTGKTDFNTLAKLVQTSAVVVCNDSVVAHLARLYEVPCVVFMGPTCEAFGFVTAKDFHILQKELLCRPCDLHGGKTCPIGTFECMKDITATEAVNMITEVLHKPGKNIK